MSEQAIEQQIQAKGLTAPRVKPEDLTANISDAEFVTHVSKTGKVLRWAILTTQNGYAVVGKPSVSVSPENDNEQIGRQVAYDNSRNELWPLMGYALAERLHNTPPPVDNAHVAPGCQQFSAETIAACATGSMITFDDFVQHGRNQGVAIVNDMPWSFKYQGQAVTHENDKCYLVGNGTPQLRFTPDHVLYTSVLGELFLREVPKPGTLTKSPA